MLYRLTIRPAYGRTYKTAEEVRKDWDANLDFFIVETQQYVNRTDFAKYGNPLDFLMYFAFFNGLPVVFYHPTCE